MNEEILKRIPLFSSMPEAEIDILASILKSKEIEEGTFVFCEGEPGRCFFILIDGEVDIIKALGSADERLLATRPAGSILGEMSLFNPEGVHTATVRARTPLTVLEMSHADLDQILQKSPSLAYEMMRVISLRLAEAENLTIRDLREKNQQLTKAYEELKAAQAQIIEKEKLERELEVAREIQSSILPRVQPHSNNFVFGHKFMPVSAVGGDFFDFIPLDENSAGIAIGDVTDHGVPAALFMALTVTLLRAESRRTRSPCDTLTSVNRQLLEFNDTGMFVTMIYGILDTSTHKFQYVRAGHSLPFLLDANGDFIDIEQNVGQPLGLFEEIELDEQSISLPKKGLLFMYTDGLTEAMNENDEFFGEDRLRLVLQQNSHHSASQVCESVWASLQSHLKEKPQQDDVTVMSMSLGEHNGRD
jgi:sigma-B regulation protein RsbU (phosphoserine phosphatase)